MCAARRSLAANVVVLALSAASQAMALPYTFTTLDDPLISANGETSAFGINDAGVVVGFAQDGSGTQAFVYSGGVFTNPSAAAGVTLTNSLGVNNLGVISGQTTENATPVHGYLLNGTSISFIDEPQAQSFTVINGLNDAGDLAGTFDVSTGLLDLDLGFVRIGSTFTALPDPDVANGSTRATDINNLGDALFFSANSGRSYLYSNGASSLIGTGNFLAMGLNDTGQIVGYIPNLHPLGVVFDHGVSQIITVPGAVGTFIQGINNRGDIVGYYQTADSRLHGFIGAPTPEPGSWALLILGMAGVGALLRRRRIASTA